MKNTFWTIALVAIAVIGAGLFSVSRTDSDTAPTSLGSADLLRGTLKGDKYRRLVLFWANGDFEFWDTENCRRLGRVERLPRPVGWCDLSPDGATVVVGDLMPNLENRDDAFIQSSGFVPTISVWDLKSGSQKRAIKIPDAVGSKTCQHEWNSRWLDDSRLLIVRLLRQNRSQAATARLIIVDTVIGKIAGVSEAFDFGEIASLSPSRRLVLVQEKNYVRRSATGSDLEIAAYNVFARTNVIDVESLKVVSTWAEPPDAGNPHEKETFSILARWAGDGDLVITADARTPQQNRLGPSARLWDARQGKLLQTFSGHTDYILDIAVTGHKLLTASNDRTVRVWDTRTGKVSAVLKGHTAGVNKIVILPGGEIAVSAAEDQVAKIWDLTTGKLKFDLPGHDSAVRDIQLVSATTVCTRTKRGVLSTWDCSTGRRLKVATSEQTFPKEFGSCEIVEKDGVLSMRRVPGVKDVK